jgi:hypothetical protein
MMKLLDAKQRQENLRVSKLIISPIWTPTIAAEFGKLQLQPV